HKIKPDILLYGEGWTAGASPLPDSLRALKANTARLDRIAAFSDDIRDGIKGSVFEHADKGFASGKKGMEESIKFGITASCPHPQVEYSKVNYSKAPWATSPAQTVSYCECHDNHVLFDKLAISAKDATPEQREQMHRLALSIVLTSQGISFLHAGTEFMRTKQGVENSYESPDSINAINWNLKKEYQGMNEYLRELIQLRKQHPAFRLRSADAIARGIKFKEKMPDGMIVYEIDGKLAGDSWSKILICLVGNKSDIAYPVDRTWTPYIINNKRVKSDTEAKGQAAENMNLSPFSFSLFYLE
nr:hypothetical protein [Chitinophagaceae bacterium]